MIDRFPYGRLIRIYTSMKSRCYRDKNINYKYYGGRGIIICNEWKNNPSLFYSWAIDNGYDDKLELDRIDVNGNYEPRNCRWVSKISNMRNRRSVIKIMYEGKMQNLIDVTERLGLKHSSIYQLVKHFNYSGEEAINRWLEKDISAKKRMLKNIIDGNYVFFDSKNLSDTTK